MTGPDSCTDLPGFVRALRELVAASNLTHRGVADRAGVPKTTVTDLLNPRRRRLDLDVLVAVVNACGGDPTPWRSAYLRIQSEGFAGGPVGVLRQLPADLGTFTGRADILKELFDAVTALPGEGRAATVVVSAIEGMGGIGKTQLAVHLAHELLRAGHYVDVQLFVNLRGFDPEQPPVDPAAALEAFLRQLEVRPQQIPDAPHERAAMFRDRLHGRRALLLLDNAADEDQVRDLIPAEPGCLVLVTSRRSLAGLENAVWHQLGVFSEGEALALLARIAGQERVGAQLEAARRIVRRCGLLPLAVSLAATRLRSRPAWQPSDLAERLEREDATTSDIGGAAFDVSYRDLPDQAKSLFRLLGIHPGLDFTAASIAAPAGLHPFEAERTLELLLDENLLQQTAPRRYEIHDLLRAYAAERAEAEMAEADRRTAIRTALSWHVAAVTLTALAVSPDRVMPPIDPAVAGISAPQAHNSADAVHWYDRERANLMQAVEVAGRLGFASLAWRLPVAMAYFEELAQNYRELERLMSTALTHARDDANPDAETDVVRWLTFALRAQGRAAEAIGPLNRVLEARRAAGDGLRTGRLLGSLAEAHYGIGDPGQGLRFALEAIRTIEETGGPVPSTILTVTSMCLIKLGRLLEALEYQLAFVERARKADDPRAVALGQHNVGDNYLLQGRMEDAAEAFEEAIAVAAAVGDRYVQADCLNGLAVTLKARGLIEAARARHREAVAVFDDLPEQEAARYLAQLNASSLRYVE